MTSGDTNTTNHPTQIAVLGTLAEFHKAPLPYDLAALVDLVLRINPDLLCLDISLSQWQRQDFSSLPAEYSQVLLPLAAQTDMVVVPVGGEQMMPRATAVGWRSGIISWARSVLAQMQAGAPGPDAINQGWRHHLGNMLYSLTRLLSDSAVDHAYHAHIEQVSQAVLQVAENNPGNRILVVTNIQYCHHIRPRLRQHDGVNILAYSDL
jgi:hypothetical protein